MSNFNNISKIMNQNANLIGQQARKKRLMEEDNHKNTLALLESSESLQTLLDGSSTFVAIKSSVENLAGSAPVNHDTLISAFGMLIDEVQFQYPHTIILTGTHQSGNRSSVVAHFSQIVIEVIHVARTEEQEPKEVGFHTLS